jgi:hypothetical protein
MCAWSSEVGVVLHSALRLDTRANRPSFGASLPLRAGFDVESPKKVTFKVLRKSLAPQVTGAQRQAWCDSGASRGASGCRHRKWEVQTAAGRDFWMKPVNLRLICRISALTGPAASASHLALCPSIRAYGSSGRTGRVQEEIGRNKNRQGGRRDRAELEAGWKKWQDGFTALVAGFKWRTSWMRAKRT